MGYGGSVLAMINSLRNNARQRPNLRTAFNREEIERRKRITRIQKWRKLDETQRVQLHSELSIQKKYAWKKEIMALVVTLMLTIVIIWLFIVFVLPEISRVKKDIDFAKEMKKLSAIDFNFSEEENNPLDFVLKL